MAQFFQIENFIFQKKRSTNVTNPNLMSNCNQIEIAECLSNANVCSIAGR